MRINRRKDPIFLLILNLGTLITERTTKQNQRQCV